GNRTPTVRPAASTVNSVAGSTVTCDASIGASAWSAVKMTRLPDSRVAASGSTCTSVARGPCVRLTAAAPTEIAASTPTVTTKARTNRRRWRAERRVLVLIRILGLRDGLDARRLDRQPVL